MTSRCGKLLTASSTKRLISLKFSSVVPAPLRWTIATFTFFVTMQHLLVLIMRLIACKGACFLSRTGKSKRRACMTLPGRRLYSKGKGLFLHCFGNYLIRASKVGHAGAGVELGPYSRFPVLMFFDGFGAQRLRLIGRHDDEAVLVRENDIAGIHYYPAAADRRIDLAVRTARRVVMAESRR